MRHWLFLLVIVMGCEFFKPKAASSPEPPIAQVQNEFLYLSDLEGIFSGDVSKKDSIQLVEKYISDWVKKQLMIAAATQSTDINEAEIERKVLDYKYALIVHSFERRYINQHLVQDIEEAEILQYYKEKSDNFLLKQNIIKCIFAQIPKNAPNISNFRKNIKDYPKNKDEVIAYAAQFGSVSFLEDSIWVNFDEIVLGTPLEENSNKSAFLKSTNFSETSDATAIYFLVILDYRIIGESSPLEFIREDIRNIILNKRKITLKKELEDNIYEDAKENGLFKIFTE